MFRVMGLQQAAVQRVKPAACIQAERPTHPQPFPGGME
jgi:hypothetical protein